MRRARSFHLPVHDPADEVRASRAHHLGDLPDGFPLIVRPSHASHIALTGPAPAHDVASERCAWLRSHWRTRSPLARVTAIG